MRIVNPWHSVSVRHGQLGCVLLAISVGNDSSREAPTLPLALCAAVATCITTIAVLDRAASVRVGALKVTAVAGEGRRHDD